MATSTIKNTNVKVKSFTFDNLAQYTASGYYVTVPNFKTKAGIPSGSIIVALTLTGWSGLGTNPNLGFSGAGALWVFFTNGTTLTSSSYAVVNIAYI